MTYTSIALNGIFALTNLIIAECVFRILCISKEFYQRQGHYPLKNRSWIIIHHGFTFKNNTIYLIAANLLIILSATEKHEILQNIVSQIHLIPVYVLFRGVKASHSTLDAAKWIRSNRGLDYATGIAANYFHGYVNLLIPSKGDGLKGIRERFEEYEDKHGVEFAIKRLFVIIPDSMHMKPKIQSRLLEKATTLGVVLKDRTGVERPYKNDVYRFTEKIKGKTYYICMEGATPLMSFYETMNSNLTSTPEMKALQREILLQFYRSITNYTKMCPDTEQELEFVYYNDYTADGQPIDVGLVLKNRIESMWEKGLS